MTAASGEGCIFCAIVRGDAPCHRIHEDDRTFVFMDVMPVSLGHVLVIPKRHCENVFEAEPEDLAAVMATSKPIAHALRKGLVPDGVAVIQLNGAAAGQTVFHYHMHLIPRMQGDKIGSLHGRKRADDAELADTAARIRAALDG